MNGFWIDWLPTRGSTPLLSSLPYGGIKNILLWFEGRIDMFTVFFDTDEMPQDFNSYSEAKAYAEERVKWGFANKYTIECA